MCSSISRFGVLTTGRFFFSSWCLNILLFFFSLSLHFSLSWVFHDMEFEVIQKIELIVRTPDESTLQINMEMQMWREMKRKLKTLRLSQLRPICFGLNICYEFFSCFAVLLFGTFFCTRCKNSPKKNQSLVIGNCVKIMIQRCS